MKERSIILRPHEVRGLLDGTVTQLWRPAKEFVAHCDTWPDEIHPARESGWIAWWGPHSGEPLAEVTKREYQHGISCPWGEPGQRLWGRETFFVYASGEVIYRADYGPESYEGGAKGWSSSAQMSRHYSRILLEIERVCPVRVWEMTEDDARSAGAHREFRICVMDPSGCPDYRIPLSYRGGFANQWNRDNPRYPWEHKPWAWQIVVRRIAP